MTLTLAVFTRADELTNIACVVGVNGEGVGIVWHDGLEQHPNPIKKPVSNKQPSLKGLSHAILGNFSTDQVVIELTKI